MIRDAEGDRKIGWMADVNTVDSWTHNVQSSQNPSPHCPQLGGHPSCTAATTPHPACRPSDPQRSQELQRKVKYLDAFQGPFSQRRAATKTAAADPWYDGDISSTSGRRRNNDNEGSKSLHKPQAIASAEWTAANGIETPSITVRTGNRRRREGVAGLQDGVVEGGCDGRLLDGAVGGWIGWWIDRLVDCPVGRLSSWSMVQMVDGPVGRWSGWSMVRLVDG